MGKITFLLRMPKELKEWYGAYAKSHGWTRTGLMLQVLWAFHDQEDAKQKAR